MGMPSRADAWWNWGRAQELSASSLNLTQGSVVMSGHSQWGGSGSSQPCHALYWRWPCHGIPPVPSPVLTSCGSACGCWSRELFCRTIPCLLHFNLVYLAIDRTRLQGDICFRFAWRHRVLYPSRGGLSLVASGLCTRSGQSGTESPYATVTDRHRSRPRSEITRRKFTSFREEFWWIKPLSWDLLCSYLDNYRLDECCR